MTEEFRDPQVSGITGFPGMGSLEMAELDTALDLADALRQADEVQRIADRVAAMGKLMTGGPENL